MRTDFYSLAEGYNLLKKKWEDKTLTYKQLYEELPKVGVSGVIIQKMITKGYIQGVSSETARIKLYKLLVVNHKQFENMFLERRAESKKIRLKKQKQKEESTEFMIQTLQKQGFKVLAPKFDIEKFKEENPGLYKKYLVYE